MHLLAFVAVLALVWSARYYTDFIARDPYNFDHPPAWYSKLATVLLITAPFPLLAFGAHMHESVVYNAILSLAVSSLIVPAVFANRTGEGGTWIFNIAEKALAAALLAPFVSFLTTHVPMLWWYALLVAFGAFSMWSRRLLLLVAVQDEAKPAEWNDMRVRAMQTFIRRATTSYWMLAFGLGVLVQHSHVGAETWNGGVKQLWRELLRVVGW